MEYFSHTPFWTVLCSALLSLLLRPGLHVFCFTSSASAAQVATAATKAASGCGLPRRPLSAITQRLSTLGVAALQTKSSTRPAAHMTDYMLHNSKLRDTSTMRSELPLLYCLALSLRVSKFEGSFADTDYTDNSQQAEAS